MKLKSNIHKFLLTTSRASFLITTSFFFLVIMISSSKAFLQQTISTSRCTFTHRSSSFSKTRFNSRSLSPATNINKALFSTTTTTTTTPPSTINDQTQILKSPILNILRDRGFLYQCTNLESLDSLFLQNKSTTKQQQPLTAYLGFDATAPSLHVGSLSMIMLLLHLQKCGHKPIVLIGGTTSKIGDPSGKSEGRVMLDDGVIESNAKSLQQVFSKFLKFEEVGKSGETDNCNAVMVNNNDWLSRLNYIEFLASFGRYFSIPKMLAYDSVKTRLAQRDVTNASPLSFLEFNYMIFQAYDFLHLHENYGCKLQIGGSDQWGNILSGVDLIRKVKSNGGDDDEENGGEGKHVSIRLSIQ